MAARKPNSGKPAAPKKTTTTTTTATDLEKQQADKAKREANAAEKARLEAEWLAAVKDGTIDAKIEDALRETIDAVRDLEAKQAPVAAAAGVVSTFTKKDGMLGNFLKWLRMHGAFVSAKEALTPEYKALEKTSTALIDSVANTTALAKQLREAIVTIRFQMKHSAQGYVQVLQAQADAQAEADRLANEANEAADQADRAA